MSRYQAAVPLALEGRHLGPAIVTRSEGEDGYVDLHLDGPGPRPVLRARVAVPRLHPLAAGEEVLVVGDPAGLLYVIGRLEPTPFRRELLLEHDPTSGMTRIEVPHGSLELATEDGDIELRSARAIRIDARTIEMSGHELTVKTSAMHWVTNRLETWADTLVEKTRNAYRTVEELAQLRTGRLRTLVEQTYQLTSQRAFLKSREDFKIKSDKIHLG